MRDARIRMPAHRSRWARFTAWRAARICSASCRRWPFRRARIRFSISAASASARSPGCRRSPPRMGAALAARRPQSSSRYQRPALRLFSGGAGGRRLLAGRTLNGQTSRKQLPGILAAFVVMLAGFWLADRIGQAILAAQGLTGSSPVSGVPVAIVLGLLLRNPLPLPAVARARPEVLRRRPSCAPASCSSASG